MKVEVGKKYRIKVYKKRPWRWNENGEMDKYMGIEVTIRSIDNGGSIQVEEIREGGNLGTGWYFKEMDFEPVETPAEKIIRQFNERFQAL